MVRIAVLKSSQTAGARTTYENNVFLGNMTLISNVAYPEEYLRHCHMRVVTLNLTLHALQWVQTDNLHWTIHAESKNGSDASEYGDRRARVLLIAPAFDLQTSRLHHSVENWS